MRQAQRVRQAHLDLRVQPVRQVQLAPRVRQDLAVRLEQRDRLAPLAPLVRQVQLGRQGLQAQLVRVAQL